MPATLLTSPSLPRIAGPATLSATTPARIPGHDARVFRGLPWLSPACSRRWLGDRWFVFSQPPTQTSRVSIVSSRLSQRLDLEHWWFALLRTAVLQVGRFDDNGKPETLLPIIPGTAPAEYLARTCRIFHRTPLTVYLPEHANTPDIFPRDPAAATAWLQNSQTSLPKPTPDTQNSADSPYQLLVSPMLPGAPPDGWSDFRKSIPLADRLLFALATRIIVLRCRSGGHISQLIHHHLHDSPRATVPTMVAADEHGLFPDVLNHRCTGWIPWLCLPTDACSTTTDSTPPAPNPSAGINLSPPPLPGTPPLASASRTISSTIPASATAATSTAAVATAVSPNVTSPLHTDNPLTTPQNWLCHWTRAALGPWPGETREEFLDKCILSSGDADRSAIATLLRILHESRLRASPEAIRGGHTVTAFTQVPLPQFRARRVFRPHRRRYDFEPWGLAIRQSTLAALGARPVIYGTEELWQNLQPTDQPFFQKIAVDGGLNSPAEREWRLPRDLLLTEIPTSDLFIFVDSTKDAALVADSGPWQVLVLPPIPDNTAHHTPAHLPPVSESDTLSAAADARQQTPPSRTSSRQS
jgi:hypothetical protein